MSVYPPELKDVFYWQQTVLLKGEVSVWRQPHSHDKAHYMD